MLTRSRLPDCSGLRVLSTTPYLAYSQRPPSCTENMDPIPNYLSVWELAHRWHGAIPSANGDLSVTREIRDVLLALVHAIQGSALTVFNNEGTWLGQIDRRKWPLTAEPAYEPPPRIFEEMLASGILDRSVLQEYSIPLESVFRWCINKEYDVPDFCIPAWARVWPKAEIAPRAKVRIEAEDKAKCQETAARKWAENPHIRIAAMAKDPDIKVQGNGGIYRPPTMLRWLREIAPDTVKGRPGRPRRQGGSQK